jgi:hypothetical protein
MRGARCMRGGRREVGRCKLETCELIAAVLIAVRVNVRVDSRA